MDARVLDNHVFGLMGARVRLDRCHGVRVASIDSSILLSRFVIICRFESNESNESNVSCNLVVCDE